MRPRVGVRRKGMRTKRGNAGQETGSKHQEVTLCDALYQFYEAE
ncbi:MAG: hypothetical protein QNJ74_17400 [Trichodesmium sp. MO_231.B1]|nr:hypothetical protein [Trichodesmium sp. MO_231.B1]